MGEVLACNLKRLRCGSHLQLTQAQLALELGISRNTYAKYESGEREPPAWFVQRAAEFFGVPMEALMVEESTDRRGSIA